MKRKATQQHQQKLSYRWKRKVFAVILVGLCFGSLVLMQTQYSRIVSLRSRFPPKPKIAFLFIARNRLPLDMVWDKPGFLFNKVTTRSAYFLSRQLNDSIQVDWGGASMIEAERVLLRHALLDPFNERFVFLSDRQGLLVVCICQCNAVSSFADTKEGRYNPKMAPVIPVHNWRKGSQWVILMRKHAKAVVNDTTVFPMFQQHCRARLVIISDQSIVIMQRKSLPEFWRDRPFPADPSKEHNCIPDEHYVQTLLAVGLQVDSNLPTTGYMKLIVFLTPFVELLVFHINLIQEGLEGEITRRSLTYSSWDLSSSKDRERRGWHPVTYKKLITSIMRLNTEENGVAAKENLPRVSSLPENLRGLLLSAFLICSRGDKDRGLEDIVICFGYHIWSIEYVRLSNALLGMFVFWRYGSCLLSWVGGVKPGVYTFSCDLRTCGGVPDLKRGKEIHVHVAILGVQAWSVLH
ncbi:hypothetical protein JRO89_XS01G0236100 [Xanthoceras sorbifolium]|uniref:Uncharacterized protein n=2 Tax=Magnoliopsida TaxID=3398 RepID=A0ABQ8IKW8_9ROSI|nr:hypothetical protein JRO89_XS01G0236100 [Xanthoceras sorbifolium]